MEFKVLISRWRTKRVGFDFNMLAWFYLCEDNGIELHELGDMPQDKMYEELLYAAHKAYMTLGKRNPYAKDKVLAWVELMTKADAERLAKGIMDSRVFGKTVAEHADGVKKK